MLGVELRGGRVDIGLQPSAGVELEIERGVREREIRPVQTRGEARTGGPGSRAGSGSGIGVCGGVGGTRDAEIGGDQRIQAEIADRGQAGRLGRGQVEVVRAGLELLGLQLPVHLESDRPGLGQVFPPRKPPQAGGHQGRRDQQEQSTPGSHDPSPPWVGRDPRSSGPLPCRSSIGRLGPIKMRRPPTRRPPGLGAASAHDRGHSPGSGTRRAGLPRGARPARPI